MQRTNAEGAAQLAQWLRGLGYEPRLVPIQGIDTILHLKSGLSWLGDGRLLVIDALAERPEFADFECVAVNPGELYAANAVRVNDRVLIAAGFARLEARLRALDYSPIALDMGEAGAPRRCVLRSRGIARESRGSGSAAWSRVSRVRTRRRSKHRRDRASAR